MKTSEFDYPLPAELIAQHPLQRRDSARMMLVDRGDGSIRHMTVADLPAVLRRGDLLVMNDTRVVPARLSGRKSVGGGRAELLLVEKVAGDAGEEEWRALVRVSGRAREGLRMEFGGGELAAEVIGRGVGGEVRLKLRGEGPVDVLLRKHGMTPLPPYIRRTDGSGEEQRDRVCYQTVYARVPGAVAAPTAGLHFTEPLLSRLEAAGIGRAFVTLHVGPGTFRPVKTDNLEDHVMDEERYEVPRRTADAMRTARDGKGRIAAVGTTVVRTLESVFREKGNVVACDGRTSLFIHPPDTISTVDVLLTNFHLPCSTLLMLVCVFGGMDLILRAYSEAVREKYRFYSYGDCMLIL